MVQHQVGHCALSPLRNSIVANSGTLPWLEIWRIS
jgi:hypothetical protein